MIDSASFERDPRSAKLARRFVTDRLQGYDSAVVDDVVLMVSELVTNSIQHATRLLTLKLEVDERTIRVAVSDGGPGSPSLQNPRPEEPNGRGLQLIATLADDWGAGPHHDGGNTVWFSVHVDEHSRRQHSVDEADLRRRSTAHSSPSDTRPPTAHRRSPDNPPPALMTQRVTAPRPMLPRCAQRRADVGQRPT